MLNKIRTFLKNSLCPKKSYKKPCFRPAVFQSFQKTRGQIAVLLIIATALLFVFYAMATNFSRISEVKALVQRASVATAASYANLMGSYAEAWIQETLGGRTKYCRSTSVWGMFIALVLIIVVSYFAPWSAGWSAPVVLSLFAIAFSLGALILQITYIQPGLSELWNEMMSENMPEKARFYEQGLQAGLQYAVTDQVFIADEADFDMDAYVSSNSANPEDTIARFAYYYTMRLLSAQPEILDDIDNYLAALGDLIYGEVTPPFVLYGDRGNGFGLYDPVPIWDITEFLPHGGGFNRELDDPCLDPNRGTRPAECNSCCIPEQVDPGGGIYGAYSSTICLQGYLASESGCEANSRYPGYPFIYQPGFDNPWNHGLRHNVLRPAVPSTTAIGPSPVDDFFSFRELVGRDDEHPDFQVDMDHANALRQDPGSGELRAFDCTGFRDPWKYLDFDDRLLMRFINSSAELAAGEESIEYKKGIFPFFWKYHEWGVGLEFLDTAAHPVQCHWYDLDQAGLMESPPEGCPSSSNAMMDVYDGPYIELWHYEIKPTLALPPVEDRLCQVNPFVDSVLEEPRDLAEDFFGLYDDLGECKPPGVDKVATKRNAFECAWPVVDANPYGRCSMYFGWYQMACEGPLVHYGDQLGAEYKFINQGMWTPGTDRYCNDEYPYTRGCHPTIPGTGITTHVNVGHGEGWSGTEDVYHPETEAEYLCGQRTSSYGGFVSPASYEIDVLDGLAYGLDDFIVWGQEQVQKTPGEIFGALEAWYEEASQYVEVPPCYRQSHTYSGCEKPYIIPGLTGAECYLNCEDEFPSHIRILKRIAQIVGSRVRSWATAGYSKRPVGVGEPWCVPTEMPEDVKAAEAATFEDERCEEGGAPGSKGYGCVYAVYECLAWNVFDEVELEGNDLAVGNAEKFDACARPTSCIDNSEFCAGLHDQKPRCVFTKYQENYEDLFLFFNEEAWFQYEECINTFLAVEPMPIIEDNTCAECNALDPKQLTFDPDVIDNIISCEEACSDLLTDFADGRFTNTAISNGKGGDVKAVIDAFEPMDVQTEVVSLGPDECGCSTTLCSGAPPGQDVDPESGELVDLEPAIDPDTGEPIPWPEPEEILDADGNPVDPASLPPYPDCLGPEYAPCYCCAPLGCQYTRDVIENIETASCNRDTEAGKEFFRNVVRGWTLVGGSCIQNKDLEWCPQGYELETIVPLDEQPSLAHNECYFDKFGYSTVTTWCAEEAAVQVEKFWKRWDFLARRLAEVGYISSTMNSLVSHIDPYYEASDALIRAVRDYFANQEEYTLPPSIIYGWKSYPSEDNDFDPPWHLVKVDGYIPGSLPKIDTYTKDWGMTRCYEIRNNVGSVQGRVSRADENRQRSIFFPGGEDNAHRIWDISTFRGAADTGGWNSLDNCSTHGAYNFTGGSPPPDAFMLKPDDNCWNRAKRLLERDGISITTCAGYDEQNGKQRVYLQGRCNWTGKDL